MYSITVDRADALVNLQLYGMLTVADTNMLVTDLIQQITDAKLDSYGMIIDVSRCPVQSQDMVNAMGQHLTRMRRARALAVVTGTMLARLQVRRIFSQPFARFTSTLEEARNWVVLGIEPGAPLPSRNAAGPPAPTNEGVAG